MKKILKSMFYSSSRRAKNNKSSSKTISLYEARERLGAASEELDKLIAENPEIGHMIDKAFRFSPEDKEDIKDG
ncbi:MAG: hypothetical protein ACE5D1_05210 [Fidelibacterota bacterium]